METMGEEYWFKYWFKYWSGSYRYNVSTNYYYEYDLYHPGCNIINVKRNAEEMGGRCRL